MCKNTGNEHDSKNKKMGAKQMSSSQLSQEYTVLFNYGKHKKIT